MSHAHVLNLALAEAQRIMADDGYATTHWRHTLKPAGDGITELEVRCDMWDWAGSATVQYATGLLAVGDVYALIADDVARALVLNMPTELRRNGAALSGD